jgi:hypothetical protein
MDSVTREADQVTAELLQAQNQLEQIAKVASGGGRSQAAARCDARRRRRSKASSRSCSA